MTLEADLAASRAKLETALAEAEANLASLKVTLRETVAVRVHASEYPSREHYEIAKAVKKITVNEIKEMIKHGTELISEYRQLAKYAMAD